jgi:hypothetical protein
MNSVLGDQDGGARTPAAAPLASGLHSAAVNLAALGFGLLVALLLLELLLRVHNPFQARVKGNRVVLLTNTKYQIKNDVIPSLDPVVTVSRNSLGFRGANPPPDLSSKLSMVAIGGSTTQCFFLSDDKTWPARLGLHLGNTFHDVWMNNAGLDGHSTFGHIALLEDQVVKLRPKIVFFLVGANDIARDPNEEWDSENVKSRISFRSPASLMKSLSPYSEVAALLSNLFRSFNAYKRGLLHQKIDLKSLPLIDIPANEVAAYMAQNASPLHITGFQTRLRRLLADCKSAGIEPILITQPLLAGEGIDDVTHKDLARVETSPRHTGKMYWDLLEKYNDVTRELGKESGVQVADVARELPKSSKYFYDFIHYTNDGAERISAIIYNQVCPTLAARFPGHVQAACAHVD